MTPLFKRLAEVCEENGVLAQKKNKKIQTTYLKGRGEERKWRRIREEKRIR